MANSGLTGESGADDAELERLRERVAALEAEKASPRGSGHRGRSFLAAIMIVVGCILAPLSVVAVWASDEVGDTDRYVETVAPLASDPDVQEAVATRASTAVMEHLDLTALLAQVTPEDRPRLEKALGRLGDSLEGAVAGFVHDQALAVASSDRFATFWTNANRRVHRVVNKALTGEGGGAVSIDGNAVTVDLAPIVERVKGRLVDSGMTVASRIPEIHTDFTIVESEKIAAARTYVRMLQLAGFWLPIIALVLVAGGVLLAVRRRRALIGASLGVAVTVGLLGIALVVIRAVYPDSLPADVSQPAAVAVFDALTRFLRGSVRMVVTLAVVVALAAWLTGSGKRAGLLRGVWTLGIAAMRGTADRAGLRTGPVGPFVGRHRGLIAWILVGAAVLGYLLWPHPTGWVVVGLAAALLLALAVLEFLADEPTTDPDAGDRVPGSAALA